MLLIGLLVLASMGGLSLLAARWAAEDGVVGARTFRGSVVLICSGAVASVLGAILHSTALWIVGYVLWGCAIALHFGIVALQQRERRQKVKR